MANGSVQIISKVPGNRTLAIRDGVLKTDVLDVLIDREEFVIRKDCLSNTIEKVDKEGREVTISSQGQTVNYK